MVEKQNVELKLIHINFEQSSVTIKLLNLFYLEIYIRLSQLILEIGFIMQRILLVQRDLILNFYILGEQIRKN